MRDKDPTREMNEGQCLQAPLGNRQNAISRPRNTMRRIHVFHGFIGVIAFIAYTLPLMFLMIAHASIEYEFRS